MTGAVASPTPTQSRPSPLARHEMRSDERNMTITVGQKVFAKPDLIRRKEWDFSLKYELCIPPSDISGDNKSRHKFFAEMLGPRFNFRFFAANYWLWVGNCVTVRTGNMLRHEGKHWKQYDSSLVTQAHSVLPYINEAERDDLYHLIPAILAHGASPQEIRAKIGRGSWRRVANNSLSRNLLLMRAARRCRAEDRAAAFIRLLEIPSGVLPAIVDGANEDEIIAARITPRKQSRVFLQTLDTVRDTRRMLTPQEFNADWGLARMRREHELATKAIMERRYSSKPFASDWRFEDDGFIATLLTSPVDIATEGATQHHCVASYAGYAAKLDYSVFRIEGKERATAGARKGRIDQVYAACNAPVSDECRAFAAKVAAQYAKSTVQEIAA